MKVIIKNITVFINLMILVPTLSLSSEDISNVNHENKPETKTSLCESFLNDRETVLFEHTNSISFSEVEVFRKNNSYGIQQNGRLKFIKWYELTFEYFNPNEVASLVGLTEEGQIYHLIKFNQRTIARLLSGHNQFQNFEVTNRGRILAQDSNDDFYLYSSEQWKLPIKHTILKKWFNLWGLTSLGAITAKTLFLSDFYFMTEIMGQSLPIPLLEIFFSSAAAMTSGFAMLSKYEDMNTYPNGFILLGPEFYELSETKPGFSERELSETKPWYQHPSVIKLSRFNHSDFEPPNEDILDKKIDPNLTEPIR